MHAGSLVSVKGEQRSTSRLSSALFILPLFYLRDYNLRAITCVAKNASVEINIKGKSWCVRVIVVNTTQNNQISLKTKHI